MRRRLALLAAATTSLVVIAFLVPLAVLVQRIVEDRALSSAEVNARSLAPVVASVRDPQQLAQIVSSSSGTATGVVSVFLPDGTLVGGPAPADSNVKLGRAGRAFSASVPGGVAVFVPVVIPNSGNAVVRVLVPDARLHQGVTLAWLLLAVVGLALVGLAVLLADRIAMSVVRPTTELVGAARRLADGRLETRVDPAGPAEVVELGHAFNTLAARIEELLAAEREAAADLSHRLRTPLTALRLNVERQPDASGREQLTADVDALERGVNAVIDELRRHSREGVAASSDLGEVALDRTRFWSALAEDQGRPQTVEVAPGRWPVAITRQDLEAVLDALLGNVFAHTPERTAFAVRVGALDEHHVRLVVEDDGPGMLATTVTRGISGGGSTGLGLDIARKAAEAARGRLSISASARGGTRIEVVLTLARV